MNTRPTTPGAGADGASSVPTKMRAAVARRYGGPEVVSIEEIDSPTPADDGAVIRVEASSLNALDWHFLTGTPYFIRLMSGLRTPKRLVHGADIAGEVVAVGTEVSRFSVGDRVFGECAGGGLAEYAATRADRLVAIPDGVSYDAAAATPVAGLTAIQGLCTHAGVQPGDRVLVNGAAGGVGTMAVQIAVAAGAEVTAVCSGRNVEMVGSLGATRVIDYGVEDFTELETEFDVLFDNVGNRRARDCVRLLAPGGRYVMTTGPKARPWIDPLPKIAGTWFTVKRAGRSFHQFTADPNVADQERLAELLASGDLVPQIQRVVGLDGVAEALAEIGTGHTRAKIVVHP